tara:strand:+ start:45 stop:398 length:354 start_codon:yes stop_codon:yes gene_type:complete
MELTFKDTLMFYQTSLRNVGLYTSISLALLGTSRFHRSKGNKLFNVSFILISMIILFLAITILRTLISNMNLFNGKLEQNEQELVKEWLFIPEYLQYTLFVVLAFSTFTLYKEFMLK